VRYQRIAKETLAELRGALPPADISNEVRNEVPPDLARETNEGVRVEPMNHS